MKYSLTLNFETKEELQSFLDEGKEVASKPKASRGKKADVLDDVKIPEAPAAPSIFPASTPEAAPAPAALSPAPTLAPAFDRNIVLANISSTVNDLKTQGTPDQVIATVFANIFGKMGIAGQKIGELDNTTLSKFNTLFYPEVASIAAPVQKPVTANSFI